MYIRYIILYTSTAATAAKADLGISSLSVSALPLHRDRMRTYTHTHIHTRAAGQYILINNLARHASEWVCINGPGGRYFPISRDVQQPVSRYGRRARKGICMRQIQNGRKNDKYTICNLKPTIMLPCVGGAREKRETYTPDIYKCI